MSYLDSEVLEKIAKLVTLTLADGKTRQAFLGHRDVHQSWDVPALQADMNDLCGPLPVWGYLCPAFPHTSNWAPHWSFIISRRQF